ncbi:MAG TPA: hypothetical protein VKX17_23990 [Planctomycetota bacterium]|nr:hypothetical protein [Planctomycetota bacterium]
MSEYDDDAAHSADLQCSYCGAWIYADSPRCPKCGNYTDGLGTFARPQFAQGSKAGRTIPRIYLIAGWLVIIALLLPLLLAIYFHFKH